MAGITLAQASAKLTLWLAADDALATGRSYKINDREVTRSETQQQIVFWNNMVKSLSSGGITMRRAVPL